MAGQGPPVSGEMNTSPLPYAVNDLPYLYCWVCSEEEIRSPEDISRASKLGSAESTSRFVHPCKCSLVAHEKVCYHSYLLQVLTPFLVSSLVDPAMPKGQARLSRCVSAMQDAVPVGST